VEDGRRGLRNHAGSHPGQLRSNSGLLWRHTRPLEHTRLLRRGSHRLRDLRHIDLILALLQYLDRLIAAVRHDLGELYLREARIALDSDLLARLEIDLDVGVAQ